MKNVLINFLYSITDLNYIYYIFEINNENILTQTKRPIIHLDKKNLKKYYLNYTL